MKAVHSYHYQTSLHRNSLLVNLHYVRTILTEALLKCERWKTVSTVHNMGKKQRERAKVLEGNALFTILSMFFILYSKIIQPRQFRLSVSIL